MTDEIRNKIAKVYALVNQGVDGEKQAAKVTLDRLMKKYNIDESYVETIHEKYYYFKYSTDLEKTLLSRLIKHILRKKLDIYLVTNGQRALSVKLEYMDFVTLECSYEYFRKHMKLEFKRLVTPQLNRCRTAKSKKTRRNQLSEIFFSNYVIASKLYDESEIQKVDLSTISEAERKSRTSLYGVQGGQYKEQMTTGLYLE